MQPTPKRNAEMIKQSPGRGENILIVEDDELFAAVLSKKLGGQGYQCDSTPSLELARKKLKDKKYHLVIADIYFQKEDQVGLSLLEETNEIGIPMIVISARACLDTAKEALNKGAKRLFEKPFNTDDLLAAINEIWKECSSLTGGMAERYMHLHKLTGRECQIVRYILKGLSNKEIADLENIQEKTIKSHITNIFQKCDVKSRTELINEIIQF